MQEAISEVINFGFNKIKLNVIKALVKEDNSRSVQTLLKNHFLLDDNYEFVTKEEAAGLSVYYLVRPGNI